MKEIEKNEMREERGSKLCGVNTSDDAAVDEGEHV